MNRSALWILALVLFALPTFGQRSVMVDAQGDSIDLDKVYPVKHSFVIKTNPGAIVWGQIPLTAEYRVGFETVTGVNQSAQFDLSYFRKSPIVTAVEDSIASGSNYDLRLRVRGFRIQTQYRFYLNRMFDGLMGGDPYLATAPNGLFIAPHVSYAQASFSTRNASRFDVYTNVSHLNINLLSGFQLVFGGISMEAFMGLGWKQNRWVEYELGSKRVLSRDELRDLMFPLYASPIKLSGGFNFGIAF
ncbi:MAG: hypothetical protein ACFB10_25030 [Salibacteraceae bacterium]